MTEDPALAPAPSQDDRLFAAMAHLAFLVGFWFVGPLVIYLVKRKESRFVAFHSLQAMILHLVFTFVLIGTAIAYLIFTVSIAAVSGKEGALLLVVGLGLGLFGGGTGLIAVHGIAAYSAWQGKTWSIPIVGPIARGILGSDEGAAAR